MHFVSMETVFEKKIDVVNSSSKMQMIILEQQKMHFVSFHFCGRNVFVASQMHSNGH